VRGGEGEGPVPPIFWPRTATVPWRNYIFGPPANIRYGLTVLIHNSGHFGHPLPFWSLPPASPGLPMASYATAPVSSITISPKFCLSRASLHIPADSVLGRLRPPPAHGSDVSYGANRIACLSPMVASYPTALGVRAFAHAVDIWPALWENLGKGTPINRQKGIRPRALPGFFNRGGGK